MNGSQRLGTVLLIAVAIGPAAAHAQATRRIVIDAGHGGSDPGGVGSGMQEKNIVLDVANRFKALLDADTRDTTGGGKWIAQRTRTRDVFVGLSARAAFANAQGADRFMSIHSNAFGSSAAHGTETFAFAEGGNGAKLRNLVQAEMLAAWGLTNRGNKTANFAVLRETAMPAVLHELAFITNATDASHLRSATERQKAARAHLFAIQRHFGLARHTPKAALAGPDGEPTESSDVLDGEPLGDDPPEDLGEEPAADDLQQSGCAAGGGSGGLALAGVGLAIALSSRRRRRSR